VNYLAITFELQTPKGQS